jgi:hypothetical protein
MCATYPAHPILLYLIVPSNLAGSTISHATRLSASLLKVIHFTSFTHHITFNFLKVFYFMFRPIWSSPGVWNYSWGNCCGSVSWLWLLMYGPIYGQVYSKWRVVLLCYSMRLFYEAVNQGHAIMERSSTEFSWENWTNVFVGRMLPREVSIWRRIISRPVKT